MGSLSTDPPVAEPGCARSSNSMHIKEFRSSDEPTKRVEVGHPSEYPRPGAGIVTVIRTDTGKDLVIVGNLAAEDGRLGKTGAGGAVEAGEKWEEAMCREHGEETCYALLGFVQKGFIISDGHRLGLDVIKPILDGLTKEGLTVERLKFLPQVDGAAGMGGLVVSFQDKRKKDNPYVYATALFRAAMSEAELRTSLAHTNLVAKLMIAERKRLINTLVDAGIKELRRFPGKPDDEKGNDPVPTNSRHFVSCLKNHVKYDVETKGNKFPPAVHRISAILSFLDTFTEFTEFGVVEWDLFVRAVNGAKPEDKSAPVQDYFTQKIFNITSFSLKDFKALIALFG